MRLRIESEKFAVLMVTVVSLLTIGASYSVFASSYSSERDVQTTTSTVVANPAKVGVFPGIGIQNDLGSEIGPWWITEDLSTLVISNPTPRSGEVRFLLGLSLGVCNTTREVTITSNNRTFNFQVSPKESKVEKLIRATVGASASSYVIIQVIGPPCQAPNDPRIFFGQIHLTRFSFTS